MQCFNVVGQIANTHFGDLESFGIHGLQERLPDGHVTLACGGLAGAVAEDFGDPCGGVDAVIVESENGQVCGRHGAETSRLSFGAAVFAVTTGAVDVVHFLTGSGSGDERKEGGSLAGRVIPVDRGGGETYEKDEEEKGDGIFCGNASAGHKAPPNKQVRRGGEGGKGRSHGRK